MTKIEEEALGLLGAFRAACEDLCKRWEERDNDWRRDDVDDHHPDVERGMDIADATCARELRALLIQTPMDLRGLAPKEKPGIIDVCVMIGVLCKDVVDLSKRIEKLEKVTLAPQEER